MKAIRDGIQDYEYAQILKNLGQESFTNSIIVPIATSWSNWNHDPNALEGATAAIGATTPSAFTSIDANGFSGVQPYSHRKFSLAEVRIRAGITKILISIHRS